jgi:hypothetical protein
MPEEYPVIKFTSEDLLNVIQEDILQEANPEELITLNPEKTLQLGACWFVRRRCNSIKCKDCHLFHPVNEFDKHKFVEQLRAYNIIVDFTK